MLNRHSRDDAIVLITKWLSESTCSFAFTGAGISTESGIPDFRSPGGVWSKNRIVYFDEYMTSEDARFESWRQKSLTHVEFEAAVPNTAHQVLAEWEQSGHLAGVVTQNIDGLHQRAGNRNVYELHGTAREVACLSCQRRWPADFWVRKFLQENQVPRCPECSGLLKHATVSFGQTLPVTDLEASLELARRSALCFALGSSLVVHPAAGIPETSKKMEQDW